MRKFIMSTIVIIALISLTACGQEKNSKTSNNNKNNNEVETVEELSPEPNTTQMVDKLIKDGKSAATKASKDDTAIALEYIKTHINNLFESNDVMEQTIYYGSLLEYYYAIDNDPYKGFISVEGEIGMDAVQAVKYVYRNVESPEDTATIENINQITENLTKLQ